MMGKRSSTALVGATLCLALSPAAGRAQSVGAGTSVVARPPNVVFIMADDLGWGDLGSYGQEKIRTPRLDQMAREGTRFTQFYAGSTVCAPSRSVLMTGQHTGHTYIRGNPAWVTPSKRLPRGVDYPLPDSVQTLAEVLQQRGYITGGFGKWGLGHPGSEGDPLNQGFDRFFGYLSHIAAHSYHPEYLWDGARKVPLPGNANGGEGTFSQDLVTEEALSFIDRHRDQPFFLYIPFTIPHTELKVPEDAYAPYLNERGESIFPETPYSSRQHGIQPMPRATYAAMVSRMDRDVGRILNRLRTLGLEDNTIVFFLSDNGPTLGGGSDPEFFDSNGPFRGLKRDLYEGGIRVPMIAWGPGRVPAGRESDHVWAMWDVLPTVAYLAGARPPRAIDGVSMLAALTGRGEAPTHDFLYWEFNEGGGKQAIRRGDWKAVRLDAIENPDAPIELYHLASDPGEEHDVAGRYPEIVQEMATLMERARTRSEVFPELNSASARAAAWWSVTAYCSPATRDRCASSGSRRRAPSRRSRPSRPGSGPIPSSLPGTTSRRPAPRG
jgi:arylsulfatase A